MMRTRKGRQRSGEKIKTRVIAGVLSNPNRSMTDQYHTTHTHGMKQLMSSLKPHSGRYFFHVIVKTITVVKSLYI